MVVKIVDTGINVNNSSVVESVKANSGNDIILKSARVSFSQQALVDAPSFPYYVADNQLNEYKSAPIKHNGINAAKIVVDFYIDKSDTSMLKAVADLLRTKGIKRLYCDLAQVRGSDYFEGVVSNIQITDSAEEGTNHVSCVIEFIELM